jgi:nicotinamide-nucleotide adenylyltransferase
LALSQDAGITVKPAKFAEKEQYNGSNIRKLMIAGKPWKHLVPPAVANVIEQISGIERIKVLAGSDSNPQKW